MTSLKAKNLDEANVISDDNDDDSEDEDFQPEDNPLTNNKTSAENRDRKRRANELGTFSIESRIRNRSLRFLFGGE